VAAVRLEAVTGTTCWHAAKTADLQAVQRKWGTTVRSRAGIPIIRVPLLGAPYWPTGLAHPAADYV